MKNAAQASDVAWGWGSPRVLTRDKAPEPRFSGMRSRTSPAGMLAAGTWLVPPTGLDVTRTSASFGRVADARIHTVAWDDAAGRTLLEITLFDSAITTVDVPSLVALPASGALTARVSGIGADLDVGDFSLEEDFDRVFGVAAEPISIP